MHDRIWGVGLGKLRHVQGAEATCDSFSLRIIGKKVVENHKSLKCHCQVKSEHICDYRLYVEGIGPAGIFEGLVDSFHKQSNVVQKVC